MGRTHVLTDWVTVRGATSSTVVRQEEADYFDASDVRDVVAYVEIEDFGNSARVAVQTAPLRDETLFQPMSTIIPTGTGLQTPLPVTRFAGAAVPPAHYVRWVATGASSNWYITFRIVLNLNLVRE